MSNRSGRLTLVLTLLGVAIAAYPMWSDWWRAKSMNVVVASSSPLISTGTDESDLRLFVGDQRLESPYLVLLKIANDGGSAITTNDFEGPLVIDFGGAKVVKVSRANSDENVVRGALQSNNSTVLIQPALFNAGDHLDLAVLTTGALPRVKVAARIVGIQRVAVTTTPQPRKPSAWIGVMDLVAMSILAICAGIFGSRTAFRNPRAVVVSDTAGLPLAWAAFVGAMASAMKGLAPFTNNSANIGTAIVVALVAIIWIGDRRMSKKTKPEEF